MAGRGPSEVVGEDKFRGGPSVVLQSAVPSAGIFSSGLCVADEPSAVIANIGAPGELVFENCREGAPRNNPSIAAAANDKLGEFITRFILSVKLVVPSLPRDT